MTLKDMAEKLKKANAYNEPMSARYIARILWPGSPWLYAKTFRHNGGPSRGEWVAAGFAAKMAKRGLLYRDTENPNCWRWV